MKNKIFSENPQINNLIENILNELCPFLEEQANEISQLTAIGKALGEGKDISAVLEKILTIARRFTRADGGTLYLVSSDGRFLEFNVIQNDLLNIDGKDDFKDFSGIPLFNDDDTPNLSHVSSYVFHTGRPVNLKDVYRIRRFDFEGFRKFDKALNYRSRSMIVIPMKNHQEDIIGVLQLINAMGKGSVKPVPFSSEAQEKAIALASQASVILTQQMLIIEMKELFEAFIKAIAVSIDEKSKHTGGHIQRVTELSLIIAEKINQDTTCFKDILLSPDEIEELRIASLMHDTGKITTPEHIIAKSSRLETVFDRIELIRTRWELLKTHLRLRTAENKLELALNGAGSEEMSSLDKACNEQIRRFEKQFDIIKKINDAKGALSGEEIDTLTRIHAEKSVIGETTFAHLSDVEFENLRVEKGTLTLEERNIIKLHAHLTKKILSKLPWPKNLANIPSIAGSHHEKLDGSGYPLGMSGCDLNLQARILAVADIFEALSAPDRPYKDPLSLKQVESILKGMGEKGILDRNVIDILFRSDAHLEYAEKNLTPARKI